MGKRTNEVGMVNAVDADAGDPTGTERREFTILDFAEFSAGDRVDVHLEHGKIRRATIIQAFPKPYPEGQYRVLLDATAERPVRHRVLVHGFQLDIVDTEPPTALPVGTEVRRVGSRHIAGRVVKQITAVVAYVVERYPDSECDDAGLTEYMDAKLIERASPPSAEESGDGNDERA